MDSSWKATLFNSSWLRPDTHCCWFVSSVSSFTGRKPSTSFLTLHSKLQYVVFWHIFVIEILRVVSDQLLQLFCKTGQHAAVWPWRWNRFHYCHSLDHFRSQHYPVCSGQPGVCVHFHFPFVKVNIFPGLKAKNKTSISKINWLVAAEYPWRHVN